MRWSLREKAGVGGRPGYSVEVRGSPARKGARAEIEQTPSRPRSLGKMFGFCRRQLPATRASSTRARLPPLVHLAQSRPRLAFACSSAPRRPSPWQLIPLDSKPAISDAAGMTGGRSIVRSPLRLSARPRRAPEGVVVGQGRSAADSASRPRSRACTRTPTSGWASRGGTTVRPCPSQARSEAPAAARLGWAVAAAKLFVWTKPVIARFSNA